ncbi:MAG TPA: WbuC family cupin fold metalloprotein [Planctomycetaceae bacterium]|nr:WbuC family cupin fold metalloprotein [Planctomycetaceae bacterium]
MSSAPNVFHRGAPVLSLTEADWASLLSVAQASPLRRSRLCLHASADDLTQEMVICLLRDCYIRPHRHVAKSESFLMLSGRLTVVLFDDTGRVTQRIRLEQPGGQGAYFFRLSVPVWHAVVVDSEYAVFHETTTGPFVPGATELAAWAPEPGTATAIAYADRLRIETTVGHR